MAATAACWLAVQTKPQAEIFATFHLRRQNYPVLFLHYRARIRHARKITTALKPYFSRYLFVRVDKTIAIGPISRSPGIVGIVHQGQEPAEVPQDVIRELQARASPDGLLAPLPARSRPPLATGDRVRIVSGPLAGIHGIVVLDEGNRIRLDIKMLGRYIEASIEPDAVTGTSPAVRSAP